MPPWLAFGPSLSLLTALSLGPYPSCLHLSKVLFSEAFRLTP